MMKNHGLRRFFSLLLAMFMVCTLLPTAALAKDTTGDDETQSKTVVVDENEKKTEPPRRSSLRTRIPLHRKARKRSPLHTLTAQTAQYLPIRFTATCRPVLQLPLSKALLSGKTIPSPAGLLKSPKP